jgi:hypothetical protein
MRSSPSRSATALCVLLTGFSIQAPTAAAQEIAPPAADETLIYVIRGGRFVGGGAKVWVAVNDQTVARVENKGYAVVRAKAGQITLNLASTGIVLAAIALDDRPGQTAYLQWRVGELVFQELDAEQGRAAIAAADRTEPIEETLGNNEQFHALLNLSRLGFDVMRPATAAASPDTEHAVLTIFRRAENDKLSFGVWSEDRYLGTLAANQAVDVRLTPGEHYFMSGNVGTTLLKAQVEAGKHYYAWLDVGEMIYRVKMMPVATNEAKERDEWLEAVSYVEVSQDAMPPRAREREAMVTEWIRSVVERAKDGTVDFTEITPANGF